MNTNEKQKFIVMWYDPSNSVSKKGGVEYNGKKIFYSFEEAKLALEEDRAEEFDYNPGTQITYQIFDITKE